MSRAAAVRDYFGEIVAGWNRFWFAPTDPSTLCLIRVLAGAMLVYTHLVWSFDLSGFLGADGWVSPAVLEEIRRNGYPWTSWSFFWGIDSPYLLWIAHLLCLGVFASFMLGWKSRVTSVLAYILAVAYAGRASSALFGLDKINIMLAMYVMLGPSGAKYSLDRWLAQRKAGRALPPPEPSASANIAIRLIQIHLSIIYLFSGLGKLLGQSWWNGTAVWEAVANYEYQSLDMTWLAGWPMLVAAMSIATVAWELFYPVLIWNRLTRPIMLTMAVLVHGGIALCMGMITFGAIMIVANLAFISPETIRAIIDPFVAQFTGGAQAGAGVSRSQSESKLVGQAK